MITIIAACDRNRGIGLNNSLPWRIPEDLKRFKELTLNKVVLMGRKTFESIGRPLPKRTNVVITRDKDFKADGVLVYNSLEEALPIFSDIVVIGGGEIYKRLIEKADIIELTHIHAEYECDVFFPEINLNQWKESYRIQNLMEDIKYDFIQYKRK